MNIKFTADPNSHFITEGRGEGGGGGGGGNHSEGGREVPRHGWNLERRSRLSSLLSSPATGPQSEEENGAQVIKHSTQLKGGD